MQKAGTVTPRFGIIKSISRQITHITAHEYKELEECVTLLFGLSCFYA